MPQEIPFAPVGKDQVNDPMEKLARFINKGLVEEPENREKFQQTPIIEIKLTREQIAQTDLLALINDYLTKEFTRQFPIQSKRSIRDLFAPRKSPEPIVLQLRKLEAYLNPDHNDQDFFESFHNFTTGNIGADKLLKAYFAINNPNRFIFRGSTRSTVSQLEEVIANFDSFGTEYNPVDYHSPVDFWAEPLALNVAKHSANPRKKGEVGILAVYDSTGMTTLPDNARTSKYSWKSMGGPLAIKKEVVFLITQS